MPTTLSDQTFAPDYATPPGDTLADLLGDREMTQTELARRLGVSLKHVNQIVNGAASISVEIALGLEKVFGVSADFWLNRTSLYLADLARREERRDFEAAIGWANQFPIAELRRQRFLPRDAKGADLVAALLQFFGIAGLRQWSDPSASFRKSQKFESDPYAMSAWLRAGEIEAGTIKCEPYDTDRFLAALEDIRSLTLLEPDIWYPRLVKLCAGAGVAVVIIDTFTGARANGATRWLSPTKALIQLSLRYRWEDIFWFTFFHEAGHVILHRKKDVFVEPPKRLIDGRPELVDWVRVENEADRFASRTLIPSPYDHYIRRLAIGDIPNFAAKIGVAPAIVVGRLQYEGVIPYTHGNKLRRRFTFVRE